MFVQSCIFRAIPNLFKSPADPRSPQLERSFPQLPLAQTKPANSQVEDLEQQL
jgi:hypothetical protein